ncbi:MAG: ADP-ribosylation factor-like protein [Candidatus Heimdallarchaeota archaeon]|nr:ADP-ribosylation factor-like protein [Candidatus Heimdallarchaeota archaeon]MDH5645921.1 ADP-ribosylation factor-like protein [Candidatus Heimdallarchaeota archaeon]
MEKRKLYKISVIGENGVGKKTFMRKYTNTDGQEYNAGMNFSIKRLNFDDQPILFQFFEMSSSLRFENIKTIYHQGSVCLILIFDICNVESFSRLHKHLSTFVDSVQDTYHNKFCIILIGNKNDKRDETCLPVDDGIKYAKELSEWLGREVPYYDVSVENDDLEYIFLDIAKQLGQLFESDH